MAVRYDDEHVKIIMRILKEAGRTGRESRHGGRFQADARRQMDQILANHEQLRSHCFAQPRRRFTPQARFLGAGAAG